MLRGVARQAYRGICNGERDARWDCPRLSCTDLGLERGMRDGYGHGCVYMFLVDSCGLVRSLERMESLL